MKQTFQIPQGSKIVTVEQIGNQIITTFEAEEKSEEKYIPKVGDCVKRRIASGYVYGVLNDNGDFDYCVISPDNANGYIQESWSCISLSFNTRITPEELQAEFNKIGYEYDFETNTAKKQRWTPKEGEKYYFVQSDGSTSFFHNTSTHTDYALISFNNCYKTPIEAKKFSDYIKKYNPDEE